MRSAPIVAFLALASLGAAGCSRVRRWIEEHAEPTGPAEDLGVAAYPSSASSNEAAIHTWNAKKVPPGTFRIGYALGPTEAADVEAAHRRYAKSVSYTDMGGGQFRWFPPAGCSGDLHCLYENLVARDEADLAPLVARFKARATKLDAHETAALVVSFVQAIRYEIPDRMPFGILPPALVVSQKHGDCDSKVLLGSMLLRGVGIDSIVIASQAHRHAMLGIALPAQGTKMTYGGRDYMFTEMTAKGAPIGYMDPRMARPDDWKPAPFRWPEPAKAGSAPPKPSSPAQKKKGR